MSQAHAIPMYSEHTLPTKGQFTDLNGERYYKISHVDTLPAFFINLVSHSDHWMFISSNGGLTAGRKSPGTALFPYVPVDRIHESLYHTGPQTSIAVNKGANRIIWQPWNMGPASANCERNLYKHCLGNQLCFEEINRELNLVFRSTWCFSEEYGFVKKSELHNLNPHPIKVDLIDGLRNLLPAGTPQFTQTTASNMVDAYKWNELDDSTGMGLFTLYSGITDRAEPYESLYATRVFQLGLPSPTYSISESAINLFNYGPLVQSGLQSRGQRAHYFVSATVTLEAEQQQDWSLVVDLNQCQNQVASISEELLQPILLQDKLEASFQEGNEQLAKIMASADGMQSSAIESDAIHHYANVLFNVLRGGIFADQYRIQSQDFANSVKHFNKQLYQKYYAWLDSLPENMTLTSFRQKVALLEDKQILRLALEYLPITFGRRHGDPSRPWNRFDIDIKQENGQAKLSYQGNWRDIFQNWEALSLSYPLFIEGIIAKFVNASTADGYNPYRISKEGIDWEIEDPEDPWSYIGYWGDHQIIYLLKLLEWCQKFYPGKVESMLHQTSFSYANVPYKIKPFEQIKQDSRNTIEFDQALNKQIELDVEQFGADAKLIRDKDGQVVQVNLMEKLLVPVLAKMANFVLDGGIWLNTQRPEWNDANNALVGQGLSVVTLCYLQRYLSFLQKIVNQQPNTEFKVSSEISVWLTSSYLSVQDAIQGLESGDASERVGLKLLDELGQAASEFRQLVYTNGFSGDSLNINAELLNQWVSSCLSLVSRSIKSNLTDQGLSHSYNLLSLSDSEIKVSQLYTMLEGQVAALSSGLLSSQQAIDCLTALFNSDLYRDDQQSFMLYADRDVPSFQEKNCVPADGVENIPLLTEMLDTNDKRLISKDSQGIYRFNAKLYNAEQLEHYYSNLDNWDSETLARDKQAVFELYESVFNHHAFTGRSGAMFGFEGLGCIYWHMVAKLLLAVQEITIKARENASTQESVKPLIDLYYRVRHGLGFNKSPAEYGAFPYDPYSHTPKHAGAQQPGMTGQVKEEVISRFGELGIKIEQGCIEFDPFLLRRTEFHQSESQWHYYDMELALKALTLPENSLAFTFCQVPIIYTIVDDESQEGISVQLADKRETLDGFVIPAELSRQIFSRDGQISQISVTLTPQRIRVH